MRYGCNHWLPIVGYSVSVVSIGCLLLASVYFYYWLSTVGTSILRCTSIIGYLLSVYFYYWLSTILFGFIILSILVITLCVFYSWELFSIGGCYWSLIAVTYYYLSIIGYILLYVSSWLLLIGSS